MSLEPLYNQDILNQIPDDLLSFTLPLDGGNPTPPEIEDYANNTFFAAKDFSRVNSNVSNSSLDPQMPEFYQDYYVSPSILTQSSLSTPLITSNQNTPLIDLQDDLEEFLTPLVSPAMTPNYTDIYEFLDPTTNEQYFTPLSSPALPPTISNNNLGGTTSLLSEYPSQQQVVNHVNAALLSHQLAQTETKQQLLRDQLTQSPIMSPVAYRKSPLALGTNNRAPTSPLPFSTSSNNKKRPTLRQQIVLASPQLHASHHHHISLPTAPATPASLMKITHSHQQEASTLAAPNHIIHSNTTMVDSMPSLPPTAYPIHHSISNKKRKIAPSPSTTTSSPLTLKPSLPPPDTTTTTKPSLENRRSAHKVAEQRRRDTLKQSFDSLRKEITDVLVHGASDETIREEKEKEVKLMSKVLLLQHSYEYILRLKHDSKMKDEKMQKMQLELNRLKKISEKLE